MTGLARDGGRGPIRKKQGRAYPVNGPERTISATIPDFPKPGILFYDISTLLDAPEAAWHATVEAAWPKW